MWRKLSLVVAALSLGAGALAPAAADAQRSGGGYYGYQYDGWQGGGQGRPYRQAYRDGYNRPPVEYRGYDRRYGYDGRGAYRRRCDDTTGTVLGAIAGGLLGNAVAGRGDRLLGTVVGGAGGALAGRAVQRGGDPRYCR